MTARALEHEFAAGNRVVAIATRPATALTTVTPADARDLHLAGCLTFRGLHAGRSSPR
jgi:Mg2+-importing ATPase